MPRYLVGRSGQYQTFAEGRKGAATRPGPPPPETDRDGGPDHRRMMDDSLMTW